MNIYAVAEVIAFFGVLLALVKPLGWYMARVYRGESCGLDRVLAPVERLFYRLSGVRSEEEMSWRQYATANAPLQSAGAAGRLWTPAVSGITAPQPSTAGNVAA